MADNTYKEYDYPLNLLMRTTGGRTPSFFSGSWKAFRPVWEEVFRELPEQVRTALLGRYRDRLTYPKLAAELGLSVPQTTRLLQKGLFLMKSPARYQLAAAHLGALAKKERPPEDPAALPLYMAEGLSARARNCLTLAGASTVGDITRFSPEALRRLRGVGRSTYTEIVEFLDILGFDVSDYRAFLALLGWT